MAEIDSLSNLVAEQELLGALLLDNSLEVEVSEILEPWHFSDQAHMDIYTSIIKLINENTPATTTTLNHLLQRAPSLEKYNGIKYLNQLTSMTTSCSMPLALAHARLIQELAQKRKLININNTTVDQVISQENADVSSILDEQQQKLFELSEKKHQQSMVSFNEALEESVKILRQAQQHTGQVSHLATEIASIDRLLGGIYKTDLVIIAGRPAMGKTALATTIAYNIAKNYRDTDGKKGAVVGFFSLEMSKEQLVNRLIGRQSGIPTYKLRQGNITDFQFTEKLLPAVHNLQNLPIFIDDTAAINVNSMRNRARYLKRVHNLGLLVVDYLQLIQAHRLFNNRVTEISAITQGLKHLAKDLDIPIIALSQLSRNLEHREDKRPQLADLRESGSIEQDADVVGFVYREEYYLRQKQPADDSDGFAAWQEKMAEAHNRAEFIVSKQRHGPTGKALLYFDPEIITFHNLDK